jgi:hypothetical protein
MTRLITALFLFVSAFPPVTTLASSFFIAIEDMPVAPGLTEKADSGITFDTPGGRIVSVEAHGNARIPAVRAFYAKALPPLGWVSNGTDAYRRDDERLTLRFAAGNGELTVVFRVVPVRK